jgi:predicted TIM-barrel fold metal-dependent hydrolase
MALRIVCLEEHVADAELSQAVQPLTLRATPYVSGLGSILDEDPATEPQDRPRLQGPRRAETLAAAPIEQRLRDMDADYIGVQVLSSTRTIQMLPAAQAIELAQRANDRLAAAVANHPSRFAGFAALPWQNADAAIQELDRTVATHGFVVPC